MPAAPTELRNRGGERLDHAFTPGSPDRSDLVIIGHGVTSHHDRPYFRDLADAFAARGVASLAVTWSGNGNSEGSFEDCTISKEVDDLRAILDALEGWNVGYAGHSMGGAVGVLCAADEPRIRALCSLAGMVHVQRFVETVFGHLAPGEAMLDRPECPLSGAFLADAARIVDVLPSAAGLEVPWRLVHGTEDELVPYTDSEDAHTANPAAELVPLAGADHRFTDRHAELCAAVAPWFDAQLAR